MSLRLASLALALAGALCLSSCSGNGAELESDPNAIAIAVGARVTLTLRQHACDSSLLEACLTDRPEKINSVKVDDTEFFKIGEPVFDFNEITLDATALSEGNTLLVIEYEDFFGKTIRDEIPLLAKNITHVAPDITCDSGKQDLARYPITTNSTILVGLVAMAGDRPLASGDLKLFKDLAGFELLNEPGPQEKLLIRTPAQPATYTWDLIGSPDLEFAVYNPTDMEIRLTEGPNRVRVERFLGDTPICKHEGPSRALIEVTKGACYPLVGGYAIEGKLPVDMQAGDFDLSLYGQDTCEVSAGLDGGKILSVTLPVDEVLEAPQTGTGQPIADMPISAGGDPVSHEACPKITNLTNGSCEIINAAGYVVIPDADCFLDWSWVKDLYSADEKGYEEVTSGSIGQGLWAELHLGVLYEVLFIDMGIYSTNNLKFSSNPASGIEIKSTGCIGSDREVLAIRPTAPGNYTLNLNADNVYEPATFSLSAEPVTQAIFTTDAGEIAPVVGTQEWWFIGSYTPVKMSYQGSGGKKLYGIGPMLVSTQSSDSDATLSGYTISMGTKPAVIQLGSPVAPNVHSIHVGDATAIDGVGGLNPSQTLKIQQGVPLGECIDAYPTHGGARIYGDSPVVPRISISGTSVVVDVQFLSFLDFCVMGYEPGASTLTVSYGNASAQSVINAQP